MPVKTLFLILFSVAMSAIGQIVMKTGMSSSDVQQGLVNNNGIVQTIITSLSNVYVVSGLLLYAVSALSWLLVLAVTDVSKAYPFVGLGFILTMLMGWFILNENVGVERMIGTLLVVAGVILVART